ncbi:MAG: T9SS type A sorting domain-containing protein [Bacteroidetes bacterium]|nr:T9SS type A sorting domain-containing protein [Bacteroidota bacterium]
MFTKKSALSLEINSKAQHLPIAGRHSTQHTNKDCAMHCNIMDGCLRGVNLQNADLPAQGVPGTGQFDGIPWDNQWLNMGNAGMRVNGTNFNLASINWYHKNNTAFANPYYPGNIANVVTPWSNQTGANNCVVWIANNDSDRIEDEVLDVVDGSGQNNNGSDGDAYYRDDFAYRQLRENGAILDSLSANFAERIQFLNEQSNTAIGKFYNVISHLQKDELAMAATLLNSIVPANTIEDNLYQTLFIYMHTFAMDIELNSTQISILESIAQQTTNAGGPGVYNARAMIGWEQDDGPGVLRMLNIDNTVDVALNVAVHPNFYPNPSTGKITLPYIINENEIIDVKIVDVLGRIIYSRHYNYEQEILVDMNKYEKGIYTISVSLNTQPWFTSRITLLK